MNTGFGRNRKTRRPYIDYDLVMICMPLMLLGSSIGVLLNRIMAPLITTIGVITMLYLSSNKTYKKAKKVYREETERRLLVNEGLNSPNVTEEKEIVDITTVRNEPLLSENWRTILKEEQALLPKAKLTRILGLCLVMMSIAFVKGTRKFKSIIGLEYCGDEYWELFGLGGVACIVFLHLNKRRIEKIAFIKRMCGITEDADQFNIYKTPVAKIARYSFAAGLLASMLGTGASAVLTPVLLGLGYNVKSITYTTGFLVVLTSFISLFQSSLYGDISPDELIFFLITSFGGSLVISMIMNWYIKKKNRPSLSLFLLVAIYVISLITLPLFELWRSFNNFDEMITFNPLC